MTDIRNAAYMKSVAKKAKTFGPEEIENLKSLILDIAEKAAENGKMGIIIYLSNKRECAEKERTLFVEGLFFNELCHETFSTLIRDGFELDYFDYEHLSKKTLCIGWP